MVYLQKPLVPKVPSDRLILIVDDNADARLFTTHILRSEGYNVQTASNGDEAIDLLKVIKPDLILLDVQMPKADGFEVLGQVRGRPDYVSVIYLTAESSNTEIVRGLDAGADDYVTKPYDVKVLLARVRAQLRIKDLNDNLTRANQRLQELVEIDDLTGLFNMRGIYERLDQEIHRMRRYGGGLSVVMMDMDRFKLVNDSHDHLFGSFVLARVGRLINDTIRKVDFAARYGGDEFLIALIETDLPGAMAFCERLRRTIEAELFSKDGYEMRLTASFGVSTLDIQDKAIDARMLVRYADRALYKAKHEGRNCTRAHSDADSKHNNMAS